METCSRALVFPHCMLEKFKSPIALHCFAHTTYDIYSSFLSWKNKRSDSSFPPGAGGGRSSSSLLIASSFWSPSPTPSKAEKS